MVWKYENNKKRNLQNIFALFHICTYVCLSMYVIYVYIYIYYYPLTDCFVVSQLFCVARYAGRFKLPTHAGHCWRSRDELINDVLLWTPHT